MKSLIVQLGEDHTELKGLWEKFKKGSVDNFEIEEIARILSWVREGLNVFEELRKRGIEGVSWGEIEHIDKDVKDKEMSFKGNGI